MRGPTLTSDKEFTNAAAVGRGCTGRRATGLTWGEYWPMPWHMPDTTPARPVKLFRNGRNQAVRIPREFELPGEDALIHKEGDRLIIEPTRKKTGLLELLASMEPVDEEFELPDDPPPEPVDI